MSRSRFASWLTTLVVAALAASGCDPGDVFVELEGPFPTSLEGDFEISDAGGEDYMAFGWIETPEGPVSVHGLGRVLASGRAENGGPVRVELRPAAGLPDSYEIVAVRPLD